MTTGTSATVPRLFWVAVVLAAMGAGWGLFAAAVVGFWIPLVERLFRR